MASTDGYVCISVSPRDHSRNRAEVLKRVENVLQGHFRVVRRTDHKLVLVEIPRDPMSLRHARQDAEEKVVRLTREAHEALDEGNYDEAVEAHMLAREAQQVADALKAAGCTEAASVEKGPVEVPVGSTPPADDGHDKAPARYMTQGRETVDRMRDFCRWLARRTDAAALSVSPERLGDLFFYAACQTHQMKYGDRKGNKTGVPLRRDHDASVGWARMADHAWSGLGSSPAQLPDPRISRPDFTPYEEHPWT